MEDYRNVIPLSHEIVMVAGNPFVIEKDTRILYLEDNILLERNTQFLAGYINLHPLYFSSKKCVKIFQKNYGK